jgi:hypothetical protein
MRPHPMRSTARRNCVLALESNRTFTFAQGLADIRPHVIIMIVNARFLSYVASHDVASDVCQAIPWL